MLFIPPPWRRANPLAAALNRRTRALLILRAMVMFLS
jgi:hypothetical protein